MMKKLLTSLLLLTVLTGTASAADGYNINIQFTDAANTGIFLAHYYGKPLPTIYKVDSAVLDSKGRATLKTDRDIIGGLYLLVMNEDNRYFEFLLDNGQTVDITVKAKELPLGVSFKNSPENTRFVDYVTYLDKVGTRHQQLLKDFAAAGTKADSAAIEAEASELGQGVSDYRMKYIKQYPNTFLSHVFSALEPPKVPESIKGTDEGFQYYKEHYWDGVAFNDERLVYTPLLNSKMEEYFKRLVTPVPDSFNMEADSLLARARVSDEMFKYVMHWLTQYAQESDIMGMDAVFVHLVENYHMKGEAFWLNNSSLQKYIDRARSIAPNVIGNVAPNFQMKGVDGKDYSLYDFNSKYTLLIFWSPDCGHCREEIPRIDSLYKAEGFAKKGIKVVAFNVDKEEEKWEKMIKEKGLNDWVHVHDPEGKSKYRSLYDVYGTPSIYFLDEKKIIRGKKLDHTNIAQVLEITEKKAAEKNN